MSSNVQRLAWLTDIHLNFLQPEEVDAFLEIVVAAACDALLISGDIAESQDVAGFLSQIASHVERPVYFVLGNHDFYRGSIPAVRQSIRELCRAHPRLHYLTHCEAIELTPHVGLVGHDGWADARFGDYENSDVFLSDYALIAELAGHFELDRRPMLGRLGDEAAAHIRSVLPPALDRFEHVMLVTHVPPLREACWHEGRTSDDNWAPHFTCKAVGDAILEIMRKHPQRRLTVLCGHTHSAGETRPLDNVVIYTGGARYGSPAINRVFEVS